MKLIVTGTGRCGTGFMAQVLTRAGLPCTHEGHYGPHGWTDMADGTAESSWMAVPFLAQQPVVAVWRRADDVIASMLGNVIFSRSTPYSEFARRHADLPLDPLNAAAEFWCQWNERLLDSDVVTPIHRPDWDAIASLAGLDPDRLREAAAKAGTSVNSRRRTQFDPKFIADGTRERIDMTTEALRRRSGIPAL